MLCGYVYLPLPSRFASQSQVTSFPCCMLLPLLAPGPGLWERKAEIAGNAAQKTKRREKKKHLSEASLLTLLTVAARYDWPEKEMGPVSLMRLLILPGAALYALQCGFSLLSVRYALRPSSSSRYSLRFEIFYTRARSAQFRLRRELPCTRVVQFCLRRKLPAPGTKGGLFCVCVESRNLT